MCGSINLSLLTLLFLVETAVCWRIIYVSKNGNSTEKKECGSFIKPCKHLHQAIEISHHSDIILMDSKYIYNQYNSIVIPRSLNISSYSAERRINDDRATLDFLILIEEKAFFYIHQNFTLINISMVVNPRSFSSPIVFGTESDQNFSKVSVINCVFKQPSNYIMIFFGLFTSLDVEFVNTNFISSATNTWHARRKERALHQKDIFRHYLAKRITFLKCIFQNFRCSGTGLENSEWYFWNNTFKKVDLEIRGDMTSVHYVNNTFEDNSYLVQWNSETASQNKTKENLGKGRSTKVVDCKFRNSIARFKIDGSPTANELLISNTHFENSPVTVKVYGGLPLNVIVESCSFKGSGDYPSSSQVEFTALRSNTIIKATVLNCTFRDSVAGSVYSDGFITNIIKTTFLNNSLTDNRYFTNTRAAALTITSSTYVYLVNCTFLDNKALPTFFDSIYIVMAGSSEIFLNISNLIVVSSSIVPGAQSSILQLKSDGFMYGFPKILDSSVFCGLPNYNVYDNIEEFNPIFVRLSCHE
ncbi:uncharacterized protein [Clytia hemisphaerica]|uniref:Cnidarian restricted protein n=1 Tax=Clytia hemisphaerica TaxID=252671 RepID=A0A7M5WTB8_9CNID